tara:strand:+ start:419 stop:676 length:258 start_codon:yes stop_codon:yes gene_type:complete
VISKQPKKIASMKDPTFTELASGAGTKVTKEQLISKIIAYRNDILRLRSSWLKRMNDDTATTESKLKILENRFIAKYGSEEFYQI